MEFQWAGERVLEAVFDPTGRFVAAATPGQFVYFSVESGDVVRQLATEVAYCSSLAFSPDGELLAATGGERVLHLWVVKTERLIYVKKLWSILKQRAVALSCLSGVVLRGKPEVILS